MNEDACECRGEHDALSDAFYEKRKADLAQRLGCKRYDHTLGVAVTATHLARLYGVDERKARLAGLLHDWDKHYDDEGIRRRAEKLGLAVDPFAFEQMPALLHGPTAAAALARDFPCIPRDVLRAIELHTTGIVGMTDLDMVVYIADAIEPGRDFDDLDALRADVGKVELEELFMRTFNHILLMLVKRRKSLHPATVEVWNHYVARTHDASGGKGTA